MLVVPAGQRADLEINNLNQQLQLTTLQQLPSLKLTDIAPENGWLEDEFSFGKPYFQVRTVSFREGILLISNFQVTPYGVCRGHLGDSVEFPPRDSPQRHGATVSSRACGMNLGEKFNLEGFPGSGSMVSDGDKRLYTNNYWGSQESNAYSHLSFF